jgi:hypothetical protein
VIAGEDFRYSTRNHWQNIVPPTADYRIHCRIHSKFIAMCFHEMLMDPAREIMLNGETDLSRTVRIVLRFVTILLLKGRDNASRR